MVSAKSGAIFERALIEKYIAASGCDPVTDEPLAAEDLIELRGGADAEGSAFVAPQAQATSIPAMLAAFQGEWDAMTLEMFSLRKQLHRTRAELSAALYHHDAAVRVAARAIRERDEARRGLEELATAIGRGDAAAVTAATTETATETAPAGVPDAAVSVASTPLTAIGDARAELFALHKAQKLALPATDRVSLRQERSLAHPFKRASCAAHDAATHQLAIGSPTGAVAVLDLQTLEVSKHTTKAKKGADVTAVAFVGAEATLIVAHANGDVVLGARSFALPHAAAQFLVHPSLRNLFVAVGPAAEWSLIDSNSDETLVHHAPSAAEAAAVCADLHVDGALLGVAGQGEVSIFDVAAGTLASTLATRHANVKAVRFAPNGYWLLVASAGAAESTLEVFDLRKGSVVHAIDEAGISDVAIDPSSTLVVTLSAGTTLTVHRYVKKGKTWVDREASVEALLPLQGVQMVTRGEEEGFREGVVVFVGVGENSSVVEYKVEV